MPIPTLKAFLDEHDVKYVVISHSTAYNAHDTAHSAHVPVDAFAKAVMVKLDDRVAMAVLGAGDRLDLSSLRHAAGVERAGLANESEFADLFPGVEVGAMPPFGNLYDMPVFADRALGRRRSIAFNAGTHREVIQLAWADYERLVGPVMGVIASDEPAAVSSA